MGWQFSPADPDLFQIGTRARRIPGGSNFVSFKNAEADDILVAYRREFDKQKRIALYWRLRRSSTTRRRTRFLHAEDDSRVQPALPQRELVSDGRGFPLEWWVPLALQKYGH
jgi:hypothetical protein